jgi:hypothetical protein
MIPSQIFISDKEIESGGACRLLEMYPKMDPKLARETEDSISIILPPGNSADEIRSRFHVASSTAGWDVLPWVAYLGDSHYLRLLKHSIFNFRVVHSPNGMLHIPEKTKWMREVETQIDNLTLLVNRRRIPKRAAKTREKDLRQYLLGDG